MKHDPNCKGNFKCWDHEREVWVYEGAKGTEFTYQNGKWKVTYTEERNIPGYEGAPEQDVEVLVEIENPYVISCNGIVVSNNHIK